MIRAVVDTSVLVSAFIGRPEAAPAQLVQAIREGRLTLIVSPRLLAELSGVLERPKFERWSAQGRGAAYVAGLAAVAELRDDKPEPASATRDPEDDYLVALAERHEADALVSVDNDLLTATTTVTTIDPRALLEQLSSS